MHFCGHSTKLEMDTRMYASLRSRTSDSKDTVLLSLACDVYAKSANTNGPDTVKKFLPLAPRESYLAEGL